MGTYGRAFALKDPNNHGLGALKRAWKQPYKGMFIKEAVFEPITSAILVLS